MPTLAVPTHPTLRVRAFATHQPGPLASMPSPAWLTDLLRIDAVAPVQRSEELRTAVRDMLRHGGYKPTGRGKPASEYLLRTAQETGMRSINLIVDACNVVSPHSGLPISVIDTDRARAPLSVVVAPMGSSYVFNAGGQEIDIGGLVCLADADGPCANAVKDAQRTKTNDATVNTFSVVWGAAGYDETLERATGWYRELLARAGCTTEDVELMKAALPERTSPAPEKRNDPMAGWE
jgi:DNA/RNA-binding domain of Phe-tRNA-synthetase-like protein